MITPVLMPKLGETDTVTFTIEKWLHREGDSVRKGQSLMIVATDKTSLEVEARAGGTLRKILFNEGESVTVGTVIALLGPAKAAIPKEMCVRKLAEVSGRSRPVASSAIATSTTKAAATLPQAVRRTAEVRDGLPPSPVPLPREGPPRMSPRAKRRARELKVPLQALPLPAIGRRITDREVKAAAAAMSEIEITAAAREAIYLKGFAPPANSAAEKTDKRLKLSDIENLPPAALRIPAERAPLSALRRAVAENMAYAQQFIPQFSIDMLVVATPVLDLRRSLQKDWGRRDAPSIDDFFVRATGLTLALDEFKAFRAVLDNTDAVYRGEINVCFAVSLDDQGVVAPIVKNADRLSLKHVAQATRELLNRAKAKQLSSAEYNGGLMTISNLGMLPVQSFRAIVRPGESAILAVPSPQPRFVLEGGSAADRNPRVSMAMTWHLSLSADHRLVDGSLAARFLAKLKEFLECPERLL